MNRAKMPPSDNSNMGLPSSVCEGARASVRLSWPEQRIGGPAMAGCLGVVRLDPGDLGFEQGDPRRQLVLGVSIEALLRQLTGGVAARARKVLVVHGSRMILAALAVNGGGH